MIFYARLPQFAAPGDILRAGEDAYNKETP